MKIIEKLLSKFKYRDLVILSIMLGFAPFVRKPHLFEKIEMLFNGHLSKSVDIFDLLMHSFPISILILKYLFSNYMNKKMKQSAV